MCKWSPEHDVFCSLDGKHKSYCTPEAYHGETCWLFRNRGNGTFEDVTAKSGIFDTSSKSLGVAMLDYDHDGWPDLFVANDTQPNKLYRNQRDGTFKDVAVEAGVAFSKEGKARAGMGVDAADFDNSGSRRNRHHELRQRNDRALPRRAATARFEDVAAQAGVGLAVDEHARLRLRVPGRQSRWPADLAVANGHIDETVRNIRGNVGYAQPPHLFLNDWTRRLSAMSLPQSAAAFSQPKVAAALLRRFRSRRRPRSPAHHQ